MSTISLARVAEMLQAEKRRLEDERDRLAVRPRTGEEGSDHPDYDVNHPADAGSDLFARQKEMALAENTEGLLSLIDTALAKIHAGTYGICDVCGVRIPAARLRAVPWATMCVSCQGRFEAA